MARRRGDGEEGEALHMWVVLVTLRFSVPPCCSACPSSALVLVNLDAAPIPLPCLCVAHWKGRHMCERNSPCLMFCPTFHQTPRPGADSSTRRESSLSLRLYLCCSPRLARYILCLLFVVALSWCAIYACVICSRAIADALVITRRPSLRPLRGVRLCVATAIVASRTCCTSSWALCTHASLYLYPRVSVCCICNPRPSTEPAFCGTPRWRGPRVAIRLDLRSPEPSHPGNRQATTNICLLL